MSNDPYISVVITAYNRKDFILEAIKCALKQTLDRQYYEIIVIKNYKDEIIDDFMKRNNIISFIADGVEGEYPYIASREAHGEIISFLDDDDLMSSDKLYTIKEVFIDQELGYYHNDFQLYYDSAFVNNGIVNPSSRKSFRVTEKEKTRFIYFIERKMIYINNSCISIRKRILDKYATYLKDQIANIDRFLFLAALLSDSDLLFDSRKLNSYRIHDAQTGALVSESFDELTLRKLTFIDKSIAGSLNLLKMA